MTVITVERYKKMLKDNNIHELAMRLMYIKDQYDFLEMNSIKYMMDQYPDLPTIMKNLANEREAIRELIIEKNCNGGV